MANGREPLRGTIVWSGRPSVGGYALIYAMIALVLIAVLSIVELYLGKASTLGSKIFPSSLTIMGVVVYYPVEIVTTILILIILTAELISLAFLRAQSKYELREEGLYLDLGIINLESTYISPVAFSDARLIRTWPMRLVGRGMIIVDANDERQFKLQLIKNPLDVQSLIRRTLGRPRFRSEPV